MVIHDTHNVPYSRPLKVHYKNKSIEYFIRYAHAYVFKLIIRKAM